MPAVDRRRSCVVGGQGQREIIVISPQQPVQVGSSTVDVFPWRKSISDAQIGRRLGHQLHQPLRTCPAHGPRVAAALLPHHAGEQIYIEIVSFPRFRQQLTQFRFG